VVDECGCGHRAQACCSQTHFVCVGDREANVYDLFVQVRPSSVDLLIQAAWNRWVGHPERYLWTKMATHLRVATLTVRIPRLCGMRPNNGEHLARAAIVVLKGAPCRL
jgi:hypothetical protein